MSKLIRYSLFLLLQFIFSYASAQKEAMQWVTGAHLWVDFSSGSPVMLPGAAVSTNEGTSNICDPITGQLLFYTDGITVWDRTHQQMPNGFGLFGHLSSTQSAMIIPMPGDCNKYYLFSVDAQAGQIVPTTPTFGGVGYSLVDMTLNGGFGDVYVKNQPLLQPSVEKITATKIKDGSGYWVITHKWDSDSFYVYPVTIAGIGSPVISKIGTKHYEVTPNSSIYNKECLGYMKANRWGDRIALAVSKEINKFEVFDFDNETGILSNCQSIIIPHHPTTSYNIYGVEFAPNNRDLVYLTYSVPGDTNILYQFNITTGLSLNNAIIAKMKFVNSGFGALNLAVDGKIYMATSNLAMGVINDPDVQGVGCNFVYNGFPNMYGQQSTLGSTNIPVFMLFNDAHAVIIPEDSGFCAGDIEFDVSTPLVVQSYSWDFGDPSSGIVNIDTAKAPTHFYADTGTYTIILILNYECRQPDTIYKQIHVSQSLTFDLGLDTSLNCTTSSINLQGPAGYNNYQWSNGSTQQNIVVNSPGAYWLRIDSGWCKVTDTVHVSFENDLYLDLGPDTLVNCDMSSILLTGPAGYNYLWSNNSTSQSMTVSQPGMYWLTISENLCDTTDTISVILDNDITLDLPDNIVLSCSSEQMYIQGPAGFDYLWNTGSTTQAIEITDPGTYSLTIIRNSCSAQDSTVVTLKNDIQFDLGNNTALTCESGGIILSGPKGFNYQWSTGSTNQDITIQQSGKYYLTITKGACIQTDSIVIGEPTDTQFFIPTAFTPNGDGRNDEINVITTNLQAYTCTIYDRFGELMYKLDNHTIKGWDGTYKGQPVQIGTYYYYFTGTCSNGISVVNKGDITLIR